MIGGMLGWNLRENVSSFQIHLFLFSTHQFIFSSQKADTRGQRYSKIISPRGALRCPTGSGIVAVHLSLSKRTHARTRLTYAMHATTQSTATMISFILSRRLTTHNNLSLWRALAFGRGTEAAFRNPVLLAIHDALRDKSGGWQELQ